MILFGVWILNLLLQAALCFRFIQLCIMKKYPIDVFYFPPCVGIGLFSVTNLSFFWEEDTFDTANVIMQWLGTIATIITLPLATYRIFWKNANHGPEINLLQAPASFIGLGFFGSCTFSQVRHTTFKYHFTHNV